MGLNGLGLVRDGGITENILALDDSQLTLLHALGVANLASLYTRLSSAFIGYLENLLNHSQHFSHSHRQWVRNWLESVIGVESVGKQSCKYIASAGEV